MDQVIRHMGLYIRLLPNNQVKMGSAKGEIVKVSPNGMGMYVPDPNGFPAEDVSRFWKP